MADWTLKRIVMIVGLSTIALHAASAEDHDAAAAMAPPAMVSGGSPAARASMSNTALPTNPALHATADGEGQWGRSAPEIWRR